MHIQMNRTIKSENIDDWEDLDILHIYDIVELHERKDCYHEGYELCMYERNGKHYQFNYLKGNPPFQELEYKLIKELDL